ncbi:hypothetical protein [Flavobacterium sp. FlaQc-28]|uniref:hypothetical protein n=1 Tax=Flavobacterium sp. FlaQc-28 TaxID=3374178 RepID=UPI003757FA6A
MNKFLNLVLGTTDVPTYLAGLIFALIGLAFYFYGKVKKRNALSEATPEKFSIKFLLQDNLVDIVFSLLAIFLALRFSVEYAGVEVTMFYALGIGWGLPKFIAYMYSFQEKARDN